jgi:hypothetical protein
VRSFVLLGLVVFGLLLAPVAIADDDLSRARALEAQLEYEQALSLVDGMLARGGADPARYVELHLMAGRLAGGLDRPEIAREHFARVLALRPATTLPDGTSPKITEPFAAARARSTALDVKIVARRGLVSIEPTDTLGIVAGIAVHTLVAGKHADVVERDVLRAVVPEEATIVEVAALDASGNRVWIGAPSVGAIGDNETIGARLVVRRPIYAWWPTYAAIAGLALAVGGVSAWRFSIAQDEFDRLRAESGTEFSELEGVERRGRRWGLAANLGFGAAVVSGVVAVIVGVRGRGDRDVVVAPSSTGLAIGGRF